ncbi:hypothetical protein [Clostridium amylolyticum]|uniref:hypothetical protein n=1 Tax=Clostridium amylolyticum TaxID=1121298 RepID=UPI000934F1B6|nr:hypothetical protein [Clostridium amylolyticum]
MDKLVYNYGDSELVGFTLNGAEYFYIRNVQDDIIGILDSNGVEVVKYTYDTWGKLISLSIREKNKGDFLHKVFPKLESYFQKKIEIIEVH